MAYLFLDTTDHLVLGILDSEFSWLDYIDHSDKKNSGRIHAAIFEMLQKQKIEVKELEGIIQIAGPGSYTGMRLSEGIVQVMEWNGIPAYSFHHFEIPKEIDGKPYIWFSNAFKGEFFCYQWDGIQVQTRLLARSQMEQVVADFKGSCYTHFAQPDFSDDIKSTSSLLFQHGRDFLRHIVSSKKRAEIYYYRDLDSEFTASFV